MVETLDDKKQRKIREKEQESEENRRYLEFIQKKEQREADYKAQKAEIEAIKDQLYQKLMADQEKQRKKLEQERVRLEVIKRERERLLQEHLPSIDGFLPKGLIKTPNDTKYLNKTKGNFNSSL